MAATTSPMKYACWYMLMMNEKEAEVDLAIMISDIKMMLQFVGDGVISASAYDTAWVSLVSRNGSGDPMFPSCIEWIARNQLADGSWGDDGVFSIQDRLINTLACVIALVSWELHPEMSSRGMAFIEKNFPKLAEATSEPMLAGFEVTFPSLVEKARSLSLNIPLDECILGEIYAERRVKMAKCRLRSSTAWRHLRTWIGSCS